MKNKILNLMSASILALVLCLTLASAASLSISNVVGNSTTVNQTAGTSVITFDLVNAGLASDINWSSSTISNGVISFSHSSIGEEATVAITATVTFNTSFVGVVSGTIVADPIGAGDSKSVPFSITVLEVEAPTPAFNYCNYERDADEETLTNKGDISIKIDKIKVIEGFGNKEEAFPLDTIEVEVDFENKGSEDVQNLELEWALYDKKNDKWIFEESESDFDLDEDDKETITIAFKLDEDVSDLEDESYTLYVKATGEVDNDDEDETCSETSDTIDVILEKDFVILDGLNLIEEASCGSDVQIVADVWNIGTKDQDAVVVTLENAALGINEKITIGDIDSLDDDKLSVNVAIPSDAEEKDYTLVLKVLDEDGDVYENKFDNDESTYSVKIRVNSGCSTAALAAVSASLVEGERAGDNIVIKAVVVNPTSKKRTYGVSVSGLGDWATLEDLSDSTITVDAGESEEVLITLATDEATTGEQSFTIKLSTDGKTIEQPVSVPFADKAEGFSFSGITGKITSGDNMYLVGGLIAINVLLVLIIIVVAVKVAKA